MEKINIVSCSLERIDMNGYKIKIQGKLGTLNVLCIIILLIGVIFLLCLGYLHSQNDGIKEVVTNWEEPQHTWNAFDIIIFPMIVGIYFAYTVRKRIVVEAQISVEENKIILKYLKESYIINMQQVRKITFFTNKKDNCYLLSFVGNKEMIISNRGKKYDKYEIIFINNVSKLCEDIKRITKHEIKFNI